MVWIEKVYTGGTKEFVYTKEDDKRIRSNDTEISVAFKEALKKQNEKREREKEREIANKKKIEDSINDAWRRYNFKCQICFKEINKKQGYVYYIDDNKKNNQPNNLIILCNKCSSKIYHKKDYWTKHLLKIIEKTLKWIKYKN